MDTTYANRFAITTTEAGEVFLTFGMEVPQYDENGKQTGMDKKASHMIVMSSGAYKSFIKMLDSIKKEDEQK